MKGVLHSEVDPNVAALKEQGSNHDASSDRFHGVPTHLDVSELDEVNELFLFP